MTTENKKTSPLKLVFTFIYILIFPALLLYISGDWWWTEGWIFGIWFLALCYTTIIYLYLRDPALLSERYQKPGAGNQKPWDRIVVYILMLGFIAWIVIMPMDARYYQWSKGFPLWLKVAGGVFLLLSSFLFFRSYSDNTYLSPLVRIQSDRKQQTITTGVYSFVRHPMYLGGILLFLGAPMLMGSCFGMLIALLMVLTLALRIRGEEKLLSTELEGYTEYQKKVRYRLIPFVW